jgi:hypothetical protein
VLTLRATDNLTISGSISDGFVKPLVAQNANKIAMPGWQLDSTGGASWSYRMTGGADMKSANPLGVVQRSDTKGNVEFAFARTSGSTNDQPVALVRAGSGSIDVAAGNNVILDTLNPTTASALGATIYTAGRFVAQASGVVAPKNQKVNPSYSTSAPATVAQFAAGGGEVSIHASNNVIGTSTTQLINNWLFRRGRTTTNSSGTTVFSTTGLGQNAETSQTAWWSRYDYFNAGVATFGGGDVSVTADRGSVSNLSVSAATSGQVAGPNGATSLVGATLTERGGGDVMV